MTDFDIAEVLSHYGVKGQFQGIETGPLLMRAMFLPEAGTKLKNITTALPDIARELGLSSLRVEPVAESHALGFEFPHANPQIIDFKSILTSPEFAKAKGALPLCLGVDILGHPQFADLAKMPHLLVAGTTGSGKSVGLNTFVLSLIARKSPAELRLVMIDPKRIEFAAYNNQQYMLFPVVTDNATAVAALKKLVAQMEERYSLFEQNMTRNIGEYNQQNNPKLPYIVCVIDEFADLVASNKEVAPLVQRLAQKARAAGIHLIMATQRPSVDVVTGVLKANFPTRLAYKVASSADSGTILDSPGAEGLIGRGDALFLMADGSLKRIHGAYISDAEINEILAPYRAKVAPLAEIKETKTAAPETVERPIKQNCVLEFWCSLKSSERKTILNWILSIFKYLIKTFVSTRKR